MSNIRVDCYAGFRADQRPLRFVLCGHTFEVAEVQDKWYAPSASYFRVRADDGNFYILRHDEVQDSWTLDAFRTWREQTSVSTARAIASDSVS